MKEPLDSNQNFKFNYVKDKNEKQYMKIIDMTIGFALLVVLFVCVYSHIM